ncbi:ABC transporter permease [Mycolicibacterium confluentis]|uniref:ABC transporter permease n=1 Tax=Mycolicibacterium confluentis TaxID=28047 RepID=UPI000A159E98|nr:ABC transporter permease [Mycolicibacterium confluentis]MCV7321227.1 ABC transporter permease [Mycolicibacterium confluentis]ORV25290.1 ABC transporter permease [Mycolicibacterium confluentis]
MSSTTLQRPGAPASPHRPRTANLAGTLGLLRIQLRRDRIVLPLWVLLLSVPLATVYIGSIDAVYPTQSSRTALAASIMASPAQRALYGNVYNDSLGAVGIWKASIFHLLIAVAVILTVIRHTRADEEAGRTELVDTCVVGRYASLTATLLLVSGAAAVTAVIGFAGLATTGVPLAGSAAFCLALLGSALVFTGVAAVAAQLSPSARFARGLTFSVLASAFALRAVGDAGAAGLSWLSPLGWSLQVRPYAGDRWWVLLLHVGTAAVLIAIAFALLNRRDVGAGLLAERPGPRRAASSLSGVFGLAWRLDRGSVLLWTAGLCLYGLMIGNVAHGVADEIGDSQIAHDMVIRLGGVDALEEAFIAVAFTMLALLASACGISVALRLHQEESGLRAEPLLAGAVSRSRWLASHLVMAAVGSGAAMLVAGWAVGLTYGIAASDVNGKMIKVLGTAAAQLPAVWLLIAVTAVLFAVVPRFTSVAWAVLAGFVALYLLGSLSGFPQWLLDLVPFVHTSVVGAASPLMPVLWLLSIDAALTLCAFAAFRRRDLR